MAKRIRTKMVYTAFQLTLVFFPFLISNSFHFNGTAEYILDILKISPFYWKKIDLVAEMILKKWNF